MPTPTGMAQARSFRVRLAILQFLFGVIHKKVDPLQMRNADCGLRNAEFKILKTAWSIAQRALRESFFFFLPKIFLLSWKNEGILHQLNAGAEE
jgi:hypothetical protein